jgi:hypothetical protein
MACGGARSRPIFAERGMSVLAGRPDARLLMRGIENLARRHDPGGYLVSCVEVPEGDVHHQVRAPRRWSASGDAR